MPTTREFLLKSDTPSLSWRCARFVFSLFAEKVIHGSDPFLARFSVLRPRENSQVGDAWLYRSKSGIQYASVLVFNASCIDRRRFPVEKTLSNTSPESQGSVGLGPMYGAEVLAAMNDSSAGDPPMDHIFGLCTSIPNYITILLNRSNETAETYTGEIIISEILPKFQNITTQPNVRDSASVLQPKNISSDQHFSILLHSDRIIGPGMLSRHQVMLPTHQLTIRVNYRLFLSLVFPTAVTRVSGSLTFVFCIP